MIVQRGITTMFFSFGRGGNTPTQRSFFGADRPTPPLPNPSNNSDNNDDDNNNDPDNNPEAQDVVITLPADRQTASNRRQDVLRVFLLITLVLFIFGGDNPPPVDKKRHDSNEDSKHRIVLSQSNLGGMQTVFSSLPPSPLHPVNVTGLYRGQWRGLVANPFLSHLPSADSAAQHNESVGFK
ncbi:hypothetical protein EON64_17415 [archaeon]|nr:MAG: hypothetical protein EON64_17415 [archaeon]